MNGRSKSATQRGGDDVPGNARYDRPIVVGYDGSAHAREAVQRSAELLRPVLALIVSVWRPVDLEASEALLGASRSMVSGGVHRLDAELASRSAELATEGVELAAKLGVAASAMPLRSNSTIWRAIGQLAADRNAAAIVVGSRGRSGFTGALLGSVSTGMLHHTDRPVLIVHSSPTSGEHPVSPESATATPVATRGSY